MYGLHIIKLFDRKDRTFEEAKSELTAEIASERFSTKAQERLEQLRNRVGEKGDLSTAAAALGLKVTATEPFGSNAASVQGLEGIPNIPTEVFGKKVGQVSTVISAPGRFIVYRIQRELPIAVPPLKEIRAKVLGEYRQEEARHELLAKAKAAGGGLSSLGTIETKKDQAIAEITEIAENQLARRALLETPVGGITAPIWASDGKLWVAKVQSRTPAEPLSMEKRAEMIKDIQSKESMKIINAELEDLMLKGMMRPGFNSLWGRINGIYVNDEALNRRRVDFE
jgi:hypothetical protein